MLAQLPARSLESLAAQFQRETLSAWQLLRGEHEKNARVYFPIDAVISIVSSMEDGGLAEAYTAGRDGMACWETGWNLDTSIFRIMCQIPGDSYSIDAGEFRAALERDAALARVTQSYAHCVLALTGRSSACNLLHGLVERCARWLLTSQDRVGKNTFQLTHDILSTMLGVHRPSVSIAMGTLQKAGLIAYARGQVTIADRVGLEEASCECYRIVADEFVRVLGGPLPMGPPPAQP